MNLGKKLSIGAVVLGFALGGATIGADQAQAAGESTSTKAAENSCGSGSCGSKKLSLIHI